MLAQAVVALAHSLELEVVAEGSEPESQLELLRRMGCELGQGYLVSPPVPAAMPSSLLSAAARPMAA
jgi:EAL domain-containing protein (putative c-di-GMP-specific phosphodiesterase class I)